MIYRAKLDEALNESGYDCVTVESGMDMAAILARASPSQARSFAVAMHERACADHDESALAFWSDVLMSVSLAGPFGAVVDPWLARSPGAPHDAEQEPSTVSVLDKPCGTSRREG